MNKHANEFSANLSPETADALCGVIESLGTELKKINKYDMLIIDATPGDQLGEAIA